MHMDIRRQAHTQYCNHIEEFTVQISYAHLVLIVDIGLFEYQQFSYSFVSTLTRQTQSSDAVLLLLYK